MNKRKKLVLIEWKAKLAKVKPKPKPAQIKKLAEKVDRKTRRAVLKVREEAYEFAPDVLVSIGIDYKRQRILVKAVDGEPSLPFIQEIGSVVRKELTLGRMQRGWGLGRDCEHPRTRISWKNYCVGTDQGVMCFKRAKFCTACGTILDTVPEQVKATLQEMVNVKAAYPQIRKGVDK
jgi:hypothetical protein